MTGMTAISNLFTSRFHFYRVASIHQTTGGSQLEAWKIAELQEWTEEGDDDDDDDDDDE